MSLGHAKNVVPILNSTNLCLFALFVVFYACLSSYGTKLLPSWYRFYGVHIFIPTDAPATGLL